MRLLIFKPRSVRAYSLAVLAFASLLSLGTLLDEPTSSCACAIADLGTPEFEAQQAWLEEAKSERPLKAAYTFGFTLIGGGLVFLALTGLGVALRPVLGPYD